MKSLDEHNAEFVAEQATPRMAGVACPNCKCEMHYTGFYNDGFSSGINGQKAPRGDYVKCSSCGNTGIKRR